MNKRLENLLEMVESEVRAKDDTIRVLDETVIALRGKISKLKGRPNTSKLEHRVETQAKRIGRLEKAMTEKDKLIAHQQDVIEGHLENIDRLERQAGSLKTQLRGSCEANDRMKSKLDSSRKDRDRLIKRVRDKAPNTTRFIAVGVLLGEVVYKEAIDASEGNSVTAREGQIVEY